MAFLVLDVVCMNHGRSEWSRHQDLPFVHLATRDWTGLTLLKNSSLIEKPLAGSIPLLNGSIYDGLIETGHASGVVL